jgi:hypothetical protein
MLHQVLHGHKVIEVRYTGINKGTAALPEGCYSIRVCMTPTAARCSVQHSNQLIQLLHEMASSPENSTRERPVK